MLMGSSLFNGELSRIYQKSTVTVTVWHIVTPGPVLVFIVTLMVHWQPGALPEISGPMKD